MRIYMDNCCFNRPFDDQKQVRVRLEAEAKLDIQNRIHDKQLDLVWSYILDYENLANPFDERKESISRWKPRAMLDVEETPEILDSAQTLVDMGIRNKDALHVACAIAGECTHFLTTDDLVLRKLKSYNRIRVLNPVEFVCEVNE